MITDTHDQLPMILTVTGKMDLGPKLILAKRSCG